MIFLLVYFIIEFLVSLKVGITIGFGWSVVWVIITSFLGVFLLRLSPYAVMESFSKIASGRLNIMSAQNIAISYILGAILLIIPGVFSDILGIILLCYTIYLRLFATIPTKQNYKKEGDDDVIDVEIIDSRTSDDTISKR